MSSAELAATVVAELVRQGVREAVLSPGSRSAPLAYALRAAEQRGELRLHVRIDERTAAFLALGLAAASDSPVPVVCTSGTAAANLHPAVLEASHRGVPLLTLTADRPAELVGTGANQTTDQRGLYAGAVRWNVALDSQRPDCAPAVARAVGWATGCLSDDPGPVHLDLAFAEPLTGVAEARGRPGPLLPARSPSTDASGPEHVAHTLVIAGDGAGRHRDTIASVARDRSWPVVAEASSGVVGLPQGIHLLAATDWLRTRRPQRVVVVGAPTLHRATQRLLADPDVEVVVVAETPRWPDAARRAAYVVRPAWLSAPGAEPDRDWHREWTTAAQRVATAVAEHGEWPDAAVVVRTAFAALPSGSVLQVGSSNPVRDLDLAAGPRPDVTVVANRGLAGIDGTVSSAVGLALARPDAPAYALMGDLTFLHDSTGLVIGPDEPRPDLTVVVVNDNGGGIFSTLEQAADPDRARFDRLFGTPTGVDLAALCRSVNVEHRSVDTSTELTDSLSRRPDGVTVLEVTVPRADRAGLLDAAARAVAG